MTSVAGTASPYLASQGIGTATTAAFRVGAVDDATLVRLCPGLRKLTGVGLNLPTFDPRDPGVPVGVVRLTPAQNLHRFISPPAGIACPADLDRHHRVVLVDNPLQAMRLHEAGVAGVAHVEDPAVLPPLAAWFAARDVVLLSIKSAGLAALRAGLGERGTAMRGFLIPAEVERISDEVRAVLGLPPRVVAAPPTSPLSLVTVRDLYEYAVRQMESAAGIDALRAAGMDHPDLIAAYRPGFLPDRYRDLLPADQRHHFDRDWKGNALVLPAFDERGVVVDLLSCKPTSTHCTRSLWSEPRGLLAPVLATACEHVIVTDTPRRLGRLTRDGLPPLLLRGVEDAQANAARLVAGGVRSVEIHAHAAGDAIGEALSAVGISVRVVRNPAGAHLAAVAARRRSKRAEAAEAAPIPAPIVEEETRSAHAAEPVAAPDVAPAPVVPVPAAPVAPPPIAPPAPLPTLVLQEHDRQGERAIFRFGAGTYTVTLPPRPTSTLTVLVAGPTRTQPMSCDLAVEAARRRNAAMLALNTGLPGPEVAAALVALLPAVLALVEPVAPTIAPLNPVSVPMRADERDEAMALLTAEDLVERWATSLAHLGADPADPATTITLLAAISRLSDRPLWAVLTAALPSERFPAITAIAQATPPDQVIHITRLTAEALNHQDPDGLRHKLLVLGDAAEISDRAATSLRLLHDRGVIATSSVERSVQHAGLKTRVVEVQGPIAVLAASVAALPHGLDHHLFAVPVDDSPEAQTRQRQAEVAPMADPATLASAQRRRESAIRRLHNAQRLLIPRPVAIPDLAVIALPAALARNRLHHDTLVGLIQASALLHQHQRPTVEGCVIATTADADRAVRLLHHVAALQSAGMSRPAHRMLTALWSGKRTRFTMDDLDALLPGWTRWSYRAALAELVALDFIAAGRGGRGKRREYALVASGPRSTSAAPLRLPVPGSTTPAEVAHG